MSRLSLLFRLLLLALSSAFVFWIGSFLSRQAAAAPPSSRHPSSPSQPPFQPPSPSSRPSLRTLGISPLLRDLPPPSSRSIRTPADALQLFYQAEEDRKTFASLRYSGHSEQDRLLHLRFVRLCDKTRSRYTQILEQSHDPRLRLAAFYRKTELLHLLMQKLASAPSPRDLPTHLHPAYRSALESIAQSYEDAALAGYRNVLRLSQTYGLYNRWSCLAERQIAALQGLAPSKSYLQCSNFPS